MSYSFRKCEFEDLDFILDLKRLGMKWYIEKIYGWDEEIQKVKTMEELKNNINDTRIITFNNMDIGVTTFKQYDTYNEVGLIIVHPTYQGRGIASEIINEYIKLSKNSNKRIIIKTFKENPARKLYEKLGFSLYKEDNTHVYLDIESEGTSMSREYLGKVVKVKMDRPLGCKHPNHGFIYPVNYGYIPGTVSGDGEELDAYVLGVHKPLDEFEGKVVAIIHRTSDDDDKLVVMEEGRNYTDEQIRALTEFQEQYFESIIIRK